MSPTTTRRCRYRTKTEPPAPEATVSAQPNGPYGPLIPMPELTPDALRNAVSRIAPSRVPALTQHLFEATTNAQQTQSLAPLRAFVHSWAVFVAIERHPERAAQLRELERIVDAGEQDPTDAITKIRRIREAAEAEAGL
ncbi:MULTISPECIES: DUF6247 family protein [unclassified Streptomyces]|uniref:DUF6247 family protein n=1 Tax=unclassified Streptomyces TaxID=2593676 RepID=UPI00203628E4